MQNYRNRKQIIDCGGLGERRLTAGDQEGTFGNDRSFLQLGCGRVPGKVNFMARKSSLNKAVKNW